MIYAFNSNIGHRAENQDSFRIPTQPESVPFAAVADGMGGHAGGSVASKMVIDAVTDELKRINTNDPISSLRRAVSKANREVFNRSRELAELNGMGSTLVCVLLFHDRFIAANVGDSRLYLFDGATIDRVTVDHSYVEMLIQGGQITEEEALVHPNRNIITRAVGSALRTEADIFDRSWNRGDILLLCSDGLSGSVRSSEMVEILSGSASLAEMCDQLVQRALDNGASDNITVVLVKCEGGECA